MNKASKEIVARLVSEILNIDMAEARIIAAEMIADDFKKNNIKTFGAVIGYLNYVNSIRVGG